MSHLNSENDPPLMLRFSPSDMVGTGGHLVDRFQTHVQPLTDTGGKLVDQPKKAKTGGSLYSKLYIGFHYSFLAFLLGYDTKVIINRISKETRPL